MLAKLAQPTHLILDYDGTLTGKDTMAILGGLPHRPKMPWQQTVDAYLQDYEVYQNTPFPWQDYSRAEYSEWLASRQGIEEKSAQRVQDVGFFRGVTQDDLYSAVSKAIEDGSLQFRDGWLKLFDAFLAHYDPDEGLPRHSRISLLSVNWSRSGIRRALYETAKRSNYPNTDKLCRYMYDLEINANEIEGLDAPYGSSGRLRRPIGDVRTSRDKLAYFPKRAASVDDYSPITVYVGDSNTDFDCLCAADVGVWLCNVSEAQYEDKAKETFRPLRFVPPPLSSLQKPSDARELFYWAPNLDVVCNFLCSE